MCKVLSFDLQINKNNSQQHKKIIDSMGGVQDMSPPFLGNLGAKFSETSFPQTYFTQIRTIVTLTQQFKTIDFDNFYCLQCSLSKVRGP